MDKHESPDALGVTDARGICILSQVLVHRQDRMLIGKTGSADETGFGRADI